jgi:urease accessory protein
MTLQQPPSWQAHLALDFAAQGERTVLTRNAHHGPLRVQKALYPEGARICHAVMLHPPAGVAGGDHLVVDVQLGPQTHAVLCTPGATQWYKSKPDHPASMTVGLTLSEDAKLDWLPQENILFNASHAQLSTAVHLPSSASALGWDTLMLGRSASGEQWADASVMQRTQIVRGGRSLWLENSQWHSNDMLRDNLAALAGHSILGTFWAVGAAATSELAQDFATHLPYTPALKAGITFLQDGQDVPTGGAIMLRVLGNDMAQVRACMVRAWQHFRPLLHGVPAVPLRLWAM